MSERMTPERLAGIRARVDAATPGPWAEMECWPRIIVSAAQRAAIRGGSVDPERDAEYAQEIALVHAEVRDGSYDTSKFPHRRYHDSPNVLADIALITHARTDIPDLLAEVDRLRAALTESPRA